MRSAGWLTIAAIFAAAVRLTGAMALLAIAIDWRSPFFASIRATALAGLIALALGLIAVDIWTLLRRPRPRAVTVLSAASLGFALTALGFTVAPEARFHWIRWHVLHADSARLETIGRHLIVGYRDPSVLHDLIERRAIAGVFIGAHNAKDKDAEAIRREIAAWQEIRRRQGLPPLWIATDQEGGSVSRLSPPLPRPQALGAIVASHSAVEEAKTAVRLLALRKGRELAGLGINLNFAPVVDLNHQVINPADRHTRIYQRAISRDPQVVTEVAGEYCRGLGEAGVRCTLKHFPGLGRVFNDTHLESAELATPVETLMQTDWVPFRALMQRPGTFTMLGHARLVAVDAERPASLSAPVVAGLLRGSWKHEGVLITDDFSMEAVHGSRDGVAGAGVAALNAGVDLLLISYDPDQVFQVARGLLQAEARGLLSQDALQRSAKRLLAAAKGDGLSMVAGD